MSEPLAIVGGGLVGALLALTLARRGQDVVVYERRPDLRRVKTPSGRSINLAVSTRGLYALQALGLAEQVVHRMMPIQGRMVHSLFVPPTFLRYGRNDHEHINSMSRADLNHLLLDAAEATGRVRICFQQRLLDYSFQTRHAQFRDEASGAMVKVAAPVVVGTDGHASVLRDALVKQTGAQVEHAPLDTGYKELTIPAAVAGQGYGPGGRFALDPSALHIWPRSRFMLMALPNVDASFTCTLFLPLDAGLAEPSFAVLRNSAQVLDFFARNFPDVAALFPELPNAFLASPVGLLGTIKTWPWSHGSALLLGDAAHAIVPFFGQGMNAGFEDCTVLARLLDGDPAGASPDWARIFAELAADRKPDTDAIADLALENYVEMRHNVADPKFLLKKAVESEFERRYPGEYRSRYQLVNFTRMPYRVAAAAGRIQEDILGQVCSGVQRVEQVDYEQVRSLVAQRLGPLLRAHGL